MIDITKLPLEELETDRQDSIDDIENCRKSLQLGIIDYSGGCVACRMRRNREFIVIIDAELKRRSESGEGES